MPDTSAPSPRTYPAGWSLDLLPEVGDDGLPYVGFIRAETAHAAAREAALVTGVAMEVTARWPMGFGYRPADAIGEVTLP